MSGADRCRVWAVANQKGGVGKTTLTVALAALLAQRGMRVLAADLDPQGSLTSYLGLEPEAVDRSAYELLLEQAPPEELVLPTAWEGLSLLPASPALATVDRRLGTRRGAGVLLRRALDRLRHRFDYALLDCPPALGLLMVNALAAADFLVVPVQTEHLALQGLERMLRTLAMVERARGGPLPRLIVPTLYDRRTRAARLALERLRQEHGEALWELVVPADTRFRDAARAGRPPVAYAPRSRGALACRALVETLLALPEAAGRRPAPDPEAQELARQALGAPDEGVAPDEADGEGSVGGADHEGAEEDERGVGGPAGRGGLGRLPAGAAG